MTQQTSLITSISVPGEPKSKARPRFTARKGRVVAYTPKDTVTAEKRYADAWREVSTDKPTDTWIAYGVNARFYYSRHQRRDVDNMLKAVLDGLNGVAWVDDNQVLEITGSKIFVHDKSEARVEVDVYELGLMPWANKNCENCGKKFRVYPSTRHIKKYCSKSCELEHRTELKMTVCTYCGKEYRAHQSKEVELRKYCSMKCKSKALTKDVKCDACGKVFNTPQSWVKEKNYCSPGCLYVKHVETRDKRRSKHYPGTCLICGAGTTRKEYKRCNPCKLQGKKIPE